jgi:hypothetical protein
MMNITTNMISDMGKKLLARLYGNADRLWLNDSDSIISWAAQVAASINYHYDGKDYIANVWMYFTNFGLTLVDVEVIGEPSGKMVKALSAYLQENIDPAHLLASLKEQRRGKQ